jgi:hypothetical protein
MIPENMNPHRCRRYNLKSHIFNRDDQIYYRGHKGLYMTIAINHKKTKYCGD